MKYPVASILTALIAVCIAYGTLSPPGPPGPPFWLNDKQIHFLAFLLLTAPMCWVNPRSVFWLIPAAILYGGAIELIQPFVGRGAEWGDFLADTLGALSGTLPGITYNSIQKQKRQRRP